MQINYEHVIEAFSIMGNLASPASEIHSARTSLLALQIGERLGLGTHDMTLLRYGADVHDTGKIFLDNNILHKAGRLNRAQRAHVEKHAELGYEALVPLRGPREVELTLLHHHEHWDGSGYPAKLAGEDIPLFARIVCVADVWDALLSDRSYRPAYSQVNALGIMTQVSTWFDPRLYLTFLDIVRGEPNA